MLWVFSCHIFFFFFSLKEKKKGHGAWLTFISVQSKGISVHVNIKRLSCTAAQLGILLKTSADIKHRGGFEGAKMYTKYSSVFVSARTAPGTGYCRATILVFCLVFPPFHGGVNLWNRTNHGVRSNAKATRLNVSFGETYISVYIKSYLPTRSLSWLLLTFFLFFIIIINVSLHHPLLPPTCPPCSAPRPLMRQG